MVFFTCNGCGEALRKNKVDQHLKICRSKSVSCVDCGKDFGHDYTTHTQCMSEDQKYGGVDYQPKANANKGQIKQEEWIQKVKTAIVSSTTSKHIRDLMQRLITYDNIPRKKQKFINFVRNSLRISNEFYAQQMWQIFEESVKSDSNQSNSINNSSNQMTNNGDNRPTNGNKRVIEMRTKLSSIMKKQKKDDSPVDNGAEELDESCLETNSKLKMNKIIIDILKSTESNQLSLKKLKKKVLKKYKSIDDNYDKQRVGNRFEKKLSKHKKVSVNEGLVSLNL